MLKGKIVYSKRLAPRETADRSIELLRDRSRSLSSRSIVHEERLFVGFEAVRACDRQAIYFPSGEYSGVPSLPGLVEIFRGVATG